MRIMVKTKYKYEKPSCPICYENKNVISDINGSTWGMCGIRGTGESGEGGNHFFYYCTKCFVDFNIKITYHRYEKDKRIGLTGNTGYQG